MTRFNTLVGARYEGRSKGGTRRIEEGEVVRGGGKEKGPSIDENKMGT